MINQLLYIVKLNLFAAIIIFAVIGISRFTQKKYSAQWKYLIWAFLAILLLVPIDFMAGNSVLNLNANAFSRVAFEGSSASSDLVNPSTDSNPVASVSDVTTDTPAQNSSDAIGAVDTSDQAVSSGTWSNVQPSEASAKAFAALPFGYHLLLIWILGIMAIGAVRIVVYRKALKRMNMWNLPDVDFDIYNLYLTLANNMNIDKIPELITNASLTSPHLFGFIHPCIYIPKNAYSCVEFEYILRHELTHYQRKDNLYKVVLMIVNTIYWFNPALPLMRKEADKDVEYLCDGRVVRQQTKERRLEYSRVLIKTAVTNPQVMTSLSSGMNDGVADLKERILNIVNGNNKKRGVALAAALILTFSTFNTLFSVSVTDAAEAVGRINDAMLSELKLSFSGDGVQTLPAETSRAIDDFNIDEANKMKPLLFSLCAWNTIASDTPIVLHDYNTSNADFFWTVVTDATAPYVERGLYPYGHGDYGEMEEVFKNVQVSTSSGDLLQYEIPGEIVRETVSALFGTIDTWPAIDQNTENSNCSYDKTNDMYYMYLHDQPSATADIDSYELLEDGSYILHVSFGNHYIPGSVITNHSFRIVKNISTNNSREPLYPYSIIEVL